MSAHPSEGVSERAEFAAQLAKLPDADAFIHGFCERHGIAHEDALRLTFFIEELFTNTVHHGHGEDTDEPIRLTLAADATSVTLLYEDTAPPFNPLEQSASPPASLDQTITSRAVGGLGVHLMFQLAANANYAYENGTNRLWLTMARGG